MYLHLWINWVKMKLLIPENTLHTEVPSYPYFHCPSMISVSCCQPLWKYYMDNSRDKYVISFQFPAVLGSLQPRAALLHPVWDVNCPFVQPIQASTVHAHRSFSQSGISDWQPLHFVFHDTFILYIDCQNLENI